MGEICHMPKEEKKTENTGLSFHEKMTIGAGAFGFLAARGAWKTISKFPVSGLSILALKLALSYAVLDYAGSTMLDLGEKISERVAERMEERRKEREEDSETDVQPE